MIKPNSISKWSQSFSCIYSFVIFCPLVFQIVSLSYSDSFLYLHHLRCDADALEDALCKRVMITPEEVIKRSLDPQSAAISRDGLAKTIYSRLFDWSVTCIQNIIRLTSGL